MAQCLSVRVYVGVFASLCRMLDMMPGNILSNYIFKIRIWIFMEAFLRIYKTLNTIMYNFEKWSLLSCHITEEWNLGSKTNPNEKSSTSQSVKELDSMERLKAWVL